MLKDKNEKFIVLFETTTSAMALEKFAKLAKSKGRLIPTPTSIRAGCGFAWCSELEEQDLITKVISDNNLSFEKYIIINI